jgi:hypothetical protein
MKIITLHSGQEKLDLDVHSIYAICRAQVVKHREKFSFFLCYMEAICFGNA